MLIRRSCIGAIVFKRFVYYLCNTVECNCTKLGNYMNFEDFLGVLKSCAVNSNQKDLVSFLSCLNKWERVNFLESVYSLCIAHGQYEYASKINEEIKRNMNDIEKEVAEKIADIARNI